VIFWMIAASGVTAAQAQTDTAVRTAIASAVQARVGVEAPVAVDLRVVEVASGVSPDAAEIEPGARFGRPARFRLRASGRTIGYAIGLVHVTIPYLRVIRPLDAGDEVKAGDVRELVGDPGALLIEPLPGAAAVVGSKSVRAVSADEVVTTRIVRSPPAVRSGDVVTTHIVVDGVDAVGAATALQSGSVGDVIRLVNAQSRRQLRGRITGKATVEVQHES
jgi:flagella basal body P-ring formation protein FlgA